MADNVDNVENVEIESGTTLDVTDKKCPNCGATVEYDPDLLKMACAYCGYTRELPQPGEGKSVDEMDFASAKLRSSVDWGTKKKSIVCKQCGGETVYDATETASSCPFCGSTSVMPVDDDEDVMAPGGVVPFEISNEKAVELFNSWLKSKIFAPSAAKKSCRAENFNGIYLPYWTYDSETTSSYEVKLGYRHKKSDGSTYYTYRTYRGVYDEFIDDQVVYASKKTDNPYIKSISTFDFKKLRAYDPQFVAGFAAERYTIGLDDGWELAKKDIQKTLKNHIGTQARKAHHADTVSNVTLSTMYDKVTFKYILAPIWQANFKFNDKVYNFVVNGQTGKIAGKAPISPLRVAIAIAIGIVVIALIAHFS